MSPGGATLKKIPSPLGQGGTSGGFWQRPTHPGAARHRSATEGIFKPRQLRGTQRALMNNLRCSTFDLRTYLVFSLRPCNFDSLRNSNFDLWFLTRRN